MMPEPDGDEPTVSEKEENHATVATALSALQSSTAVLQKLSNTEQSRLQGRLVATEQAVKQRVDTLISELQTLSDAIRDDDTCMEGMDPLEAGLAAAQNQLQEGVLNQLEAMQDLTYLMNEHLVGMVDDMARELEVLQQLRDVRANRIHNRGSGLNKLPEAVLQDVLSSCDNEVALVSKPFRDVYRTSRGTSVIFPPNQPAYEEITAAESDDESCPLFDWSTPQNLKTLVLPYGLPAGMVVLAGSSCQQLASAFPNLVELRVMGAEAFDVSPLAAATRLERLHAVFSSSRQLRAVEQLTRLREVSCSLQGGKNFSIKAFSKLSHLTRLRLWGHNVDDESDDDDDDAQLDPDDPYANNGLVMVKDLWASISRIPCLQHLDLDILVRDSDVVPAAMALPHVTHLRIRVGDNLVLHQRYWREVVASVGRRCYLEAVLAAMPALEELEIDIDVWCAKPRLQEGEELDWELMMQALTLRPLKHLHILIRDTTCPHNPITDPVFHLDVSRLPALTSLQLATHDQTLTFNLPEAIPHPLPNLLSLRLTAPICAWHITPALAPMYEDSPDSDWLLTAGIGSVAGRLPSLTDLQLLASCPLDQVHDPTLPDVIPLHDISELTTLQSITITHPTAAAAIVPQLGPLRLLTQLRVSIVHEWSDDMLTLHRHCSQLQHLGILETKSNGSVNWHKEQMHVLLFHGVVMGRMPHLHTFEMCWPKVLCEVDRRNVEAQVRRAEGVLAPFLRQPRGGLTKLVVNDGALKEAARGVFKGSVEVQPVELGRWLWQIA